MCYVAGREKERGEEGWGLRCFGDMSCSATKVNYAKWHIIDAREMVVGRLASRIATLLQGKHKPLYSPHMDIGDNVIVVNCTELEVSQRC